MSTAGIPDQSGEAAVPPSLLPDMANDKVSRGNKLGGGAAGGANDKSLKALVVRGSLWSIAGHGLGQLMRVGSKLILTRLVAPEVFGIMAIVHTFRDGLNLFTDIGVGQAIIQNKRGEDPEFYNTAWMIQILRGFLLWIGSCLLAVPVALIYGNPILAQIFPVAGLVGIIRGFRSTKTFTARRRIALGRLTCVRLAGQFIGVAAAVVLTWYTRSVWGLVIALLVGALGSTMLTHWALPGPHNKFAWSRAAAGELLTFGRWIFLSSVLTFTALQGGPLVLGTFFDMGTLGLYAIAISMVRFFGMPLTVVTNNALLPALSRTVRERRDHVRRIYLRSRLMLDVPLGAIAALLCVVGPAVIDFLYPESYSGAGPMLQILGIRVLAEYSQTITSSLFVSLGRPVYCAAANAVRTVALFTVVPIAFHLWGMQGGLLAMAVQPAFSIPCFWFGLIKYRLWHIGIEVVGVTTFGITYFLLSRLG